MTFSVNTHNEDSQIIAILSIRHIVVYTYSLSLDILIRPNSLLVFLAYFYFWIISPSNMQNE